MPKIAETAPNILRLVGDDVRWQLVRTLAASDHRVSELVDEVGLPQNLVSYHLRLLKRGDLVRERRSSADGRDVYYHLDLDRLDRGLTESANALRRSVGGSAASRPGDEIRRSRRPRVLFICTGNSARSQIAEAMLRSALGSEADVRSAGPQPTIVHPLALEVLRERGIDVAGLHSKALDEVHGIDFDLVITLCDKARENCPADKYGVRVAHWSLADPSEAKGSLTAKRRAFQATADEIDSRIRQLIPVLRTQREV